MSQTQAGPELRVLVLGDREIHDELLALVESRGGTVACFEDPAELLASAFAVAPQVVVVGAAGGPQLAAALSSSFAGHERLAFARVVLVGEPASDQDDFAVAARADVFATVGALLRFDPAARVPVRVLARYELVGVGGDPRRLGNVLELGARTLRFDSEDGLPATGRIEVGFVVPGTTTRLRLAGELEPGQVGETPRIVHLGPQEPAARRALRAFIERRLCRVPAEVLMPDEAS